MISYIEEFQENQEIAPVFHMSALTTMYEKRLVELGVQTSRLHSTRLCQRLLDAIPNLTEDTTERGHYIKLIFKADMKGALNKALDHGQEAFKIAEVAKIIRRHIFQTAQEFNGTFDDQAQERSIPNILSTLVCMILDGLDLSIIQNEEQTGIGTMNQAASTIS